MSLEMQSRCERCASSLAPDEAALICNHECTFCPACAEKVQHVCPNCGGELVRRPRRRD